MRWPPWRGGCWKLRGLGRNPKYLETGGLQENVQARDAQWPRNHSGPLGPAVRKAASGSRNTSSSNQVRPYLFFLTWLNRKAGPEQHMGRRQCERRNDNDHEPHSPRFPGWRMEEVFNEWMFEVLINKMNLGWGSSWMNQDESLDEPC